MIFEDLKNKSFLLRLIVFSCLFIFVILEVASSETSRITVVKSSGTEQNSYERISRSIVSTLKKSNMSAEIIEEVTVKTDMLAKNGFWDDILEKQPDLVITVGQRAALSANRNIPHIPVIFGEVANPDFLIQPSHPDINGVKILISAEDYFKILHEAFPSAKKAGLMLSARNVEFYRSAQNIARKMGLELVTYKSEYRQPAPVGLLPDVDTAVSVNLQDFPKALKEIIPKVDVLLIPFEFVEQIQVKLRPDLIRTALTECLKYDVPIMTAETLARYGASLSVWRDTEGMGRQTAELALKRLTQGPFPEQIIETPRTFEYWINQSVARRLGITFPKSILEKAFLFGTEEVEDQGMFPYPR